MKEIKLTIDGEEVQLTDKQLEALGIKVETKRKNPFEDVDRFEDYYFVDRNNEIHASMKTDSSVDNQMYTAANYFNDKKFAKQVALHQLLYRKLLKFAYDNECEDTAEWDEKNQHWTIYYNHNRYKFEADNWGTFHRSDVYFSSEEGAERAIEEVVKPFMKEHPEFVW